MAAAAAPHDVTEDLSRKQQKEKKKHKEKMEEENDHLARLSVSRAAALPATHRGRLPSIKKIRRRSSLFSAGPTRRLWAEIERVRGRPQAPPPHAGHWRTPTSITTPLARRGALFFQRPTHERNERTSAGSRSPR